MASARVDDGSFRRPADDLAVGHGWAPYQAFLRHLPGLLSGEAFPAFDNPNAIAKNYSVPGMVFKLGLFGLPGASFER